MRESADPDAVTPSPDVAPASPDVAPASPDVAPATLPAGIAVGEPAFVRVPQDKPVRVIEGAAGTRRAIVYLHGVCGDITAIDGWAEAASRVGTVVALLGDERCGITDRYKWGHDVVAIERRIGRALDAVAKRRGGQLDVADRVLFGYSQGVVRALSLAKRYPERYPLVVLGGPPIPASPASLPGARAVAILRGEWEGRDNARDGVAALAAAHKPVELFVLPRASHGHFGPEGDRVIGDMFHWLLAH